MHWPGLIWLARIRLLLRHLRTQIGLTITLFLIVAVTSMVIAAIPQLYNQVLDRELRYQVRQATPIQANLGISTELALPTSEELAACAQGFVSCRPEVAACRDAPSACMALVEACRADLAACMEEGSAAYQEDLPDLLGQAIGAREYAVTSPELLVGDSVYLPTVLFDRVIRLRHQSGVGDHIELVAGRMPEVAAPLYLSQATGLPSVRGEQPVPVFEIVLNETSAEAARLSVDSLLVVRAPQAMVLQVAGIFRVANPADRYWYGDIELERPLWSLTAEDSERPTLLMTGLLAPGAYGALQPLTTPASWEYSWRYFLEPNRLNAANYRQLTDELRTLQLTKGAYRALWLEPGPVRVTTGLAPLFESFTELVSLALSIAALTALGVLATGLAALTVFAALLAARRRQLISLLRGRGATTGQLMTGQVVEGIAVCVPAAATGYLLAILLVPARSSVWAALGSLATSVIAVLLLVTLASSAIRAPLSALLQRAGERPAWFAPRRLVAEGVLVLLAVGGIYLLRQRGLTAEQGSESALPFDAALAAVPVLLALAVGVASLRLYLLLLRAGARIAQQGRSLVFFFGLRRASQLPSVDHLPLLVMLLAVGISSFSAILAHSVAEAQQDAAWQAVGADYRVEARRRGSLPDTLEPEAIPGVRAAAEAFKVDDALLLSQAFAANAEAGPLTFLAVETRAYTEVTTGTRAAPDFPTTLLDTPETGLLGLVSHPIPAVASTSWPAEAEGRPEPGARVLLTATSPQTGAFELYFEIVEVRSQFAGLPRGEPFLVTSLEAVQAAIESGSLRPTTLYLAADVEGAVLEAALRDQYLAPELTEVILAPLFSLEIFSRAELYAMLAEAPLVTGIADGSRASVALAALYASIAAIAALVLSAQLRARDLGYLRTLGLSTRQALGLAIVELLPGVLIASILGVGLGTGIAYLVKPGLDLTAFVGPDVPVVLQISWPRVILVALSLVLSVSSAIAIFSFVTRRTQLGEVLRVGDQRL